MSDSWLRLIERLTRAPSFDVNDPWCDYAIKEIRKKYGDTVSSDTQQRAISVRTLHAKTDRSHRSG